MATDHAQAFIAEMERAIGAGEAWSDALARILKEFDADSGTIHWLESDGVLHLKAASAGIPQVVLDTVREVPVGKGMAGLAVERRAPVNACNIQTDTSGDVRPGARATGLQGSIVVPILHGATAVGALGIANRRERVFTDDEASLLLEVGRVFGRHRA
ncbi:MAG TPA: GAF domain-containing protein [Vicinamibacterales bacterium]|jgi:GAF domain-containing protein